MEVDLFTLVENLFQGTILFVIKFFSTLGSILTKPKMNSLLAFERFQSAKTKEIGPTTFLTVCSIIFFSALTGLLFIASQIFQMDILASSLGMPDLTSFKEAGFIVLTGTFGLVFLMEIIYRTLNLLIKKLIKRDVADENGEDVFRKAQAIGFYTTGVALLILLTAESAELSLATLHSVPEGVLWAGGVLAALSWPFFNVMPVVQFLRLPDAARLFVFLWAVTLGALIGVAWLVAVLVHDLHAGPRPSISDLYCYQKVRNIVALVQVRNASQRATLLDVRPATWHLRLSLRDISIYKEVPDFLAAATKVTIEPTQDAQQLLLKPNDVWYAIVEFPAPTESFPIIFATCAVSQSTGNLDYTDTGRWGSLDSANGN
jgi:hypothetical protein